MRGRFAFGVLAFELAELPHALHFQRHHFFGHRVVHLPAQPHEVGVVVQAQRQFFGCETQQARQFFALGSVGVQVFRADPNGRRRHAGRHDQTVAVDDAPAAGGQVERACVTCFALAQKEDAVDNLHIDRAAQQTAKTQAHQGHQKLRPPRRRFGRQQRAAGVVEAAHIGTQGRGHGCPWSCRLLALEQLHFASLAASTFGGWRATPPYST